MVRVTALCVFRHHDRILVAEGFDSVAGTSFARATGGAVKDGEASEQAIVREIAEELGQRIENVQLLGVLESLFTYEGRPRHDATFVDQSVYDRTTLHVSEAGWIGGAQWRHVHELGSRCRLVPEGLAALLGK